MSELAKCFLSLSLLPIVGNLLSKSKRLINAAVGGCVRSSVLSLMVYLFVYLFGLNCCYRWYSCSMLAVKLEPAALSLHNTAADLLLSHQFYFFIQRDVTTRTRS